MKRSKTTKQTTKKAVPSVKLTVAMKLRYKGRNKKFAGRTGAVAAIRKNGDPVLKFADGTMLLVSKGNVAKAA